MSGKPTDDPNRSSALDEEAVRLDDEARVRREKDTGRKDPAVANADDTVDATDPDEIRRKEKGKAATASVIGTTTT